MSLVGPLDLVFLHSSDEHYGADRILLDILDALPSEVLARSEFWLPTDVEHGPRPLCHTLEARGATVRHVDLPVLRRAYRRPRDLARLAVRAVRLRSLLRRSAPSMAYCTTSAMLLAAPVARSAGVRRVVAHVQEIWSGGDAAVLAILARACDRLVAISRPVLHSLPPSLRSRGVVVLNATAAPARYVPVEAEGGPLRYLVASRWNAWKGHGTLLAAWDRAGCPGTLTILGGPPPSGEAVDVRALVARISCPESVRVVGEVDDIEPHLVAADVVVVPSDEPEPFGLVAVESFARGRPVIASRGGGLADIVADGVDGWLFERADVAALTTVLTALTRPDAVRAGLAARSAYEDRFTAQRYAEEWRGAVDVG